MKTCIIIMAFMIYQPYAMASEEDHAIVTSLRLEAKTTSKTFGNVIVSATTTNGMEGTILSFLDVEWGGKIYTVPPKELDKVIRVNLSTLTISSEVGYPHIGIGPNLYICFVGHDGSQRQKYRIIFDQNGFKELKKQIIHI